MVLHASRLITDHLLSCLQKLPKVNKELALKLIEEESEEQQATRKRKQKVRLTVVVTLTALIFFVVAFLLSG